ncbi:heme peroxidase [Cyathus striatus]|nr:heme peroxidase [Cyathus striatus]
MFRTLKSLANFIDFEDEKDEPYDRDGAHNVADLAESTLIKLTKSLKEPPFRLSDLSAYIDAVSGVVSGRGIDDRKLLLEKALTLMANMQDEAAAAKIQQLVISLLYKDLPHPPTAFLCLPPSNSSITTSQVEQLRPYAFRSADGSNYNTLLPSLGKAGSPYARSVPSTNFVPRSALPDPGLVFDTLLRREKGKFTEHPGGISALFFAFADLVIHSIFNTDSHNWTINKASSYLDLSILYGSSEADVNSVRRNDGTGRLWPDVFADSRLLLMPPASCALLVLLSRNHNYIAEKILAINERGNLVSPPPEDPEARQKQDDEIFHRSRLVNCGYFMQIILGDYVGAILGLVRDGSSWRLDPLMSMRDIDHEVAPRGEGNVVSVEFNLLYRWHATLSASDTKWTEDVFRKYFEGKDFSKLTVDDFKNVAHKYLIPKTSVREWTFDGLARGPDGNFNDDDLARLLHNSTEWRAGAFQARGIPEVLRVIEVMSIEQSRSWGACSLNEFRKFLGLKPYSSFAEWNPNKDIHTAAAALYKDIDNLELHVGLQAEEAKVPGPGAGLCPGYTISRAILADAVCLTRGDRFLTVDFTPFNLTSWGYQDCQYDTQDGSYGGMLTKLLFRTLPDHYPTGSAYAHFPFLDPAYMKDNLSKHHPELVNKYTWTRPQAHLETVNAETYSDVQQVLKEASFLAPYDKRLLTVSHPVEPAYVADGCSKVMASISLDDLGSYFVKKTEELLSSKSFTKVDSAAKSVDIVKDVINLIPVHWISQQIAGLPIKTVNFQTGRWNDNDVCKEFSDIARYVYLNLDPIHDWRLRESSQKTFKEFNDIICEHFNQLSGSRFLKVVNKALGKKYDHKELAALVFLAVVPTGALFSKSIVHVVDFYLSDDKKQARDDIVKNYTSKDKDSNSKIMVYIREALRLNPPVFGVYRSAAKDVDVGTQRVKANQRVFASVVKANLDAQEFGAEAKTAVYSRSTGKAGIYNVGEQGMLNTEFFEATVPSIVGKILSLKGLKRADGLSGNLTSYVQQLHGSPTKHYITTGGVSTPWPDSMIVEYNA